MTSDTFLIEQWLYLCTEVDMTGTRAKNKQQGTGNQVSLKQKLSGMT